MWGSSRRAARLLIAAAFQYAGLLPILALVDFLLFVTSIGVFLVCVTRGPCLSWMW